MDDLQSLANSLTSVEWIATHLFLAIEVLDQGLGPFSSRTKRVAALLGSAAIPIAGYSIQYAYTGVFPAWQTVALVIGASWGGAAQVIHKVWEAATEGKPVIPVPLPVSPPASTLPAQPLPPPTLPNVTQAEVPPVVEAVSGSQAQGLVPTPLGTSSNKLILPGGPLPPYIIGG